MEEVGNCRPSLLLTGSRARKEASLAPSGKWNKVEKAEQEGMKGRETQEHPWASEPG